MPDIDVLVVGAGPTGLTASVRLAQRGISHVVLDGAPAPTSSSSRSWDSSMGPSTPASSCIAS
jgi:2-polyprenyl-6-methoxyphenol hydroxylase-like FAD-dependent oxidoreductase